MIPKTFLPRSCAAKSRATRFSKMNMPWLSGISTPQAAAHILVIPKGAYVNMDDFTAHASAAEITGYFQAIGQVARDAGLSESAGGNGYRVLCNSGPDARQEVPHLHVHIAGGELLGPMLYKKRLNTA